MLCGDLLPSLHSNFLYVRWFQNEEKSFRNTQSFIPLQILIFPGVKLLVMYNIAVRNKSYRIKTKIYKPSTFFCLL